MNLELTKLLTLGIVNLGVIYLASSGSVSGDAAIGIMGASLGYVFGNAHKLIEKK